MTKTLLTMVFAFTCVANCASVRCPSEDVYPALAEYLRARTGEFDQIAELRRRELDALADYLRGRLDAGQAARVLFACTHNSRRSQLCQVWLHVAALHYQVPSIESFSAGTEATACNPRTVATLERAGFRVQTVPGNDENPRYHLRVGSDAAPIVCYSKTIDDPANPRDGFCVVMACDHADATCPAVPGAEERLSIMYQDPKIADGTVEESQMYDERSRQISREMLYVVSQLQR